MSFRTVPGDFTKETKPKTILSRTLNLKIGNFLEEVNRNSVDAFVYLQEKPMTNYSLLCNATQLANIISVFASKTLSTYQIRIFFSLVGLLTNKFAAEKSKTSKNRKPTISVKTEQDVNKLVTEINKFSGIKHTPEIYRAVQFLEREGFITFTGDEKEISLGGTLLTEDGRDILDKISSRRSYKRHIPIPRQLLKALATSSIRTVHLTALILLLRGACLGRDKQVKNRCSMKQGLIAKIGNVTKRSVQNAFDFLRDHNLIETEEPRLFSKLYRHGLFIRIVFTQPTASEETEPASEQADNISSEKGLSTGNISPSEGDSKLSTKVDKKSETSSPDVRNIDRKQLGNKHYVFGLFFDAVEKGLLHYTFTDVLNLFCASYQARQKSKTPEKLVGWMLHKAGFGSITDESEKYVLPILKEYLDTREFLFA